MIVVTGASRGIGLAIATRLSETGKEVLGISRNAPIPPVSFRHMQADVSSASELKFIAKSLRDERLQVDALICAAGVASMNLALLTPEHEVRRIIDVNLIGTILCNQIFSPLMVRRKSGRIINFSTIAVPLGLTGESVYVASKAGIEAFSRILARELAPHNINVNCIAPGPIKTDLIVGISSEQIHAIVERQVIKKEFSVEDVSDLVEAMLSPGFNAISGQTLSVGGS